MKSKIALAIITSALLTLSACSGKPEKMSDEDKQKLFNTLEDARNIARENAGIGAAVYRQDNPRLQGMKIVTHGDSSQSAECLQGDGWATVSFMDVKSDRNNVEKYVVKCSTVSLALGCYLENDFQKKPFAAEEGHCNKSLPFPLPKLAK